MLAVEQICKRLLCRPSNRTIFRQAKNRRHSLAPSAQFNPPKSVWHKAAKRNGIIDWIKNTGVNTMICRIDSMYIIVDDLERATAFYEEFFEQKICNKSALGGSFVCLQRSWWATLLRKQLLAQPLLWDAWRTEPENRRQRALLSAHQNWQKLGSRIRWFRREPYRGLYKGRIKTKPSTPAVQILCALMAIFAKNTLRTTGDFYKKYSAHCWFSCVLGINLYYGNQSENI